MDGALGDSLREAGAHGFGQGLPLLYPARHRGGHAPSYPHDRAGRRRGHFARPEDREAAPPGRLRGPRGALPPLRGRPRGREHHRALRPHPGRHRGRRGRLPRARPLRRQGGALQLLLPARRREGRGAPQPGLRDGARVRPGGRRHRHGEPHLPRGRGHQHDQRERQPLRGGPAVDAARARPGPPRGRARVLRARRERSCQLLQALGHPEWVDHRHNGERLRDGLRGGHAPGRARLRGEHGLPREDPEESAPRHALDGLVLQGSRWGAARARSCASTASARRRT